MASGLITHSDVSVISPSSHHLSKFKIGYHLILSVLFHFIPFRICDLSPLPVIVIVKIHFGICQLRVQMAHGGMSRGFCFERLARAGRKQDLRKGMADQTRHKRRLSSGKKADGLVSLASASLSDHTAGVEGRQGPRYQW